VLDWLVCQHVKWVSCYWVLLLGVLLLGVVIGFRWRNKKMKKFTQFIFLFVLVLLTKTPFADMILSFESSEQSWVGQGESFTVTPDDGYIFSGGGARFDNSLSFRIASLNSPFGPDWNPGSGDPYNYWRLDLAAPFDQLLSVGLYNDTARYPFQDDAQSGLTFSGNHRGNNRNSGFFEVLEISFDGIGNIGTLAVDFTQYGETNPDWWINGQLRYNSDAPLAAVPLPASMWLFFIGLLFLIGLKMKNA